MTSALDFHNNLIEKKGIDHATGFSDEGQLKRFDVFLQRCVGSPMLFSDKVKLLDYGCGVGDFKRYSLDHNYRFDYYGVDLNIDFIRRFRERFTANESFSLFGCVTQDRIFDILKTHAPFDYVFASGAFCYADQQHQHDLMLRRLWALTGKMMAVNFLSATTPWGRKPIHCYYHPCMGHVTATNLGTQRYAVLCDYADNDFTLVLHKNASCDPPT